MIKCRTRNLFIIIVLHSFNMILYIVKILFNYFYYLRIVSQGTKSNPTTEKSIYLIIFDEYYNYRQVISHRYDTLIYSSVDDIKLIKIGCSDINYKEYLIINNNSYEKVKFKNIYIIL
ncbi:hypothetical protein H311_00752 [Anncaliia algerae PRA109]|nr:hypothetical protein H311_00752 [Anncaliia algerae PRA109]